MSCLLVRQVGVQVFSDENAWDVLEEIPNDSAGCSKPSTIN
jgi:hypothetical protein